MKLLTAPFASLLVITGGVLTADAQTPKYCLGTPIGPGHYDLWRANFGNPPGAGSGGGLGGAAAVPEPSAIALVLIGLTAMAFRRCG